MAGPEENDPDKVSSKIFMLTMVGTALFAGVVFFFIIL